MKIPGLVCRSHTKAHKVPGDTNHLEMFTVIGPPRIVAKIPNSDGVQLQVPTFYVSGATLGSYGAVFPTLVTLLFY